MVERESAWRRAWRDAESFRGSFRWWAFELVGAIPFTLGGLSQLPEMPSDVETVLYPGLSAVLGLTATYVAIFLLILLLTPSRQRNEAWAREAQTRGSLQARISELEETRARLEVIWRDRSPYIGNQNYYRIGVKNHGPATARSVVVKLERIEPDPLRENDRILPSLIGEKGGYCQKGRSACDINVGDEHHFDLLRGVKSGGVQNLFLLLQTLERPDVPVLLADDQEYEFVFLVTSANGAAPVPARLIVLQDDSLALSIRLSNPSTAASPTPLTS